MFSTFPAQTADFPAILALQDLNHGNNLPESARGDGFLTTRLDAEKLAALSAQNGLFVAKSEGDLAGWACAEAWDLSGARPFHSLVATLFPLGLNGSVINAQNSLLYGPVCVAARFRGQNVLPLLVEKVKNEFGPRLRFGLTFIDIRNARSLAAHERKLGFQIIAELPAGDAIYHTLAFTL